MQLDVLQGLSWNETEMSLVRFASLQGLKVHWHRIWRGTVWSLLSHWNFLYALHCTATTRGAKRRSGARAPAVPCRCERIL